MSDDPSIAGRTQHTQALITNRDGRVLLARDADGAWMLPEVHTRGHWHAEVTPVIEALARDYSVGGVALRFIRHDVDFAANTARMTLAMELRDRHAPLPPNTRWAKQDEALAMLSGEGSTAAAWLDRAAAREHPPLPPWTWPGWFAEAAAWCDQWLAGQGIAVIGPAVQMKHWCIAAIFRLPTDRGDVWFKAVPPIFAHEGALLELIGPSMPEHLPRVIAADPDRGWTLMEALPPRTLREHPEQAGDAARLLARLHRTWAGHEHELFAAGCPDRRLHTLQPGLAAILSRQEVIARFNIAERARLASFCAAIPERIAALRACGLPDTLVHGDFHRGNIATGGAAPVIFDWTDGCVSHPLFDLATFLPDGDPVDRAARLHAYLSEWTPAFSEDTLDRAWDLAEPLAYLHHAISYVRIMDAIDPGDWWEFDSDPLFWLRWLHDIASAPEAT